MMLCYYYYCYFDKITKFIRTGTADKNDFPLYFEKGAYETEVDESADINQTILTVTARNHDECKCGSIQFY
uniref:CSON012465 protein n=1 Tax=Culicoides sonorensis TaxID=179676 RepID=A0A336KMJ5_CULSO